MLSSAVTASSLVAICSLLAGAAASPLLSQRQAPCKDVYIFLGKGNNEPYPGRQGKLVNAICSGLPSCGYEDIQFYNPVEADFCASVHEGAVNGVAQVTEYARRCPDSKLVLSGYSQGAQVVGDVLGGGGGTFFNGCVQPPTNGISASSSPGNKIVAVLVFGDTRHTANQAYNVQSGSGGSGLFPRSGDMLANLNGYADRFRNYCVSTDPICAANQGPGIVETHLNYFDVFTDEAAAWVQDKVKKAGGSKPSTSSSTADKTSTTTSAGEKTTEILTVTKSAVAVTVTTGTASASPVVSSSFVVTTTAVTPPASTTVLPEAPATVATSMASAAPVVGTVPPVLNVSEAGATNAPTATLNAPSVPTSSAAQSSSTASASATPNSATSSSLVSMTCFIFSLMAAVASLY